MGIRASCQPMPVLMMVAPAASMALPSADNLLARRSAFDEIEHRQPVDDDELRPNALADAPDDLNRQPHPVLICAAPFVLAAVGALRDEFVDQIAFRAHDLDAVIAGLFSQRGAARVILDGLPDLAGGQRVRDERVDRRPHRGGSDKAGLIGVTACMRDLQRDLAALVLYGAGHDPVAVSLGLGCQHRAALHDAAVLVGRDAARNHQASLAAGPLGIESRQPLEAVRRLLKADMHRAHQHPVSQAGKAKVEGF